MKWIIISLTIVSFLTVAKCFPKSEEQTEKLRSEKYTIPTGCVKIRSFLGEKYLNATDYDDRRRLLTVEPTGDELTLYKVYNFYQILRGSEYMYVGHRAGDKRRHVFTRKTGIVEDDGHWTITEAPGFDGMVHIQSRRYHEYMFVADNGNVVNTWIKDEYKPVPEDEPGMDPKYVWELIQYQ